MMKRTLARVLRCAAVVALASLATAQELPKSGVFGQVFFYATSPSGSSQFYAIRTQGPGAALPLGASVVATPSRWAHRRRTLGALETAIGSPERGLFITPMGTTAGTGALHVVDLRSGLQTELVPTDNPAGYDLAHSTNLEFVFAAEDDGNGNTVLRGWSYATTGGLTPLSPASITLAGAPAAYVNRIGVDANGNELHVPTASGIHVVDLSASVPNMAPGTFVASGPAVPATNPARFDRDGTSTWIVGTSTFDAQNDPVAAGYLAWDATGAIDSDAFGPVPGVAGKEWVPAAGAEELAVVGDGTDAYVYYLLREPPPNTFFIKPSAVGVVAFTGANGPTTGLIAMPDSVGEPFANPSVSGTRVAFESSFGPPFINSPAGGGEKVSILYSPLDPLGSSSTFGVLGNPDPLGGRISTKGMDRPIWTPDGTRVMAATSHFPGAPNPGIPGLEVLAVPADEVVDEFSGPCTIIENLPFPNQAIVYPSVFDPIQPAAAAGFDGLTFFGAVFNQGLASLSMPADGAVGQLQPDPDGFVQSPQVVNFRAILPPVFDDVNGSLEPIPGDFGARRTVFSFTVGADVPSLAMCAALEDEIHVQKTGANLQAMVGVGTAAGTIAVPLPTGWVTTTELLSL